MLKVIHNRNDNLRQGRSIEQYEGTWTVLKYLMCFGLASIGALYVWSIVEPVLRFYLL